MKASVSEPAGMASTARRFRAPGRINIIGEHTDYNDGYVMPACFSVFTTIKATLRNDHRLELRSHALNDVAAIDIDKLERLPNVEVPTWAHYVFGVAAELQQRGIVLRGADLDIESDIPIGAGLSSSAALETAAAMALLELAGKSMTRQDMAALCQRAESRYAGVDCGIMDQYAVTICPKGHAMLLDCRSLDHEFLRIPDEWSLLLLHSGIRHQLADSAYNERAGECARATEILARQKAGVEALRDADIVLIETCKERLGEALYRRARHVVTENERTLAAADALRHGDFKTLGELVSKSHESLRDDFEVSADEIDRLVDTAQDTDGVLGARMIGGGFGGAVLALVESDAAERALGDINAACTQNGHPLPWSTIARPADPLTEIPPE